MWNVIVFLACWCLVSIVAGFTLARLFRKTTRLPLRGVETPEHEQPAANGAPTQQASTESAESTATLRK